MDSRSKVCLFGICVSLAAAVSFTQAQVVQMQQAIQPTTPTKHDDAIQVGDESGFAFASYYQSHMVLQRAPERAVLWGYASLSDLGKLVTVVIMSMDNEITESYKVPITKGPFANQAVWKVTLNPQSGSGAHVITASLLKYNPLVLHDVLFGDVWLCSGQSNMALRLKVIFGYEEIKAEAYKNDEVRLFQVDQVTSEKPLYDLKHITQQWSSPEDAKGFQDFSAVCYIYGVLLQRTLGYPIGLVHSSWGGTPVESWSPPDALASCGIHYTQIPYDQYWDIFSFNISTMPEGLLLPPRQVSVLWNAMIHPLLNMTVKGAIWYQGEANTNYNTYLYNCTFPAMIQAWRSGFLQGTGGQVPANMPFGFVQIGPNDTPKETFGYPIIRWQQMGNSVTGLKLANTFMAVAMDLTDHVSTMGSVHFRDKQTVARRLARAALSVVYKQGPALNMFPYPTSEVIHPISQFLILHFLYEKVNINVRSYDGFEVCCAASYSMCPMNGTANWVPSPISRFNSTSVTLSLALCPASNVVGYRYAWHASPCSYHLCPVYSDLSGDPLPTFIKPISPRS